MGFFKDLPTGFLLILIEIKCNNNSEQIFDKIKFLRSICQLAVHSQSKLNFGRIYKYNYMLLVYRQGPQY